MKGPGQVVVKDGCLYQRNSNVQLPSKFQYNVSDRWAEQTISSRIGDGNRVTLSKVISCYKAPPHLGCYYLILYDTSKVVRYITVKEMRETLPITKKVLFSLCADFCDLWRGTNISANQNRDEKVSCYNLFIMMHYSLGS